MPPQTQTFVGTLSPQETSWLIFVRTGSGLMADAVTNTVIDPQLLVQQLKAVFGSQVVLVGADRDSLLIGGIPLTAENGFKFLGFLRTTYGTCGYATVTWNVPSRHSP